MTSRNPGHIAGAHWYGYSLSLTLYYTIDIVILLFYCNIYIYRVAAVFKETGDIVPVQEIGCVITDQWQ